MFIDTIVFVHGPLCGKFSKVNHKTKTLIVNSSYTYERTGVIVNGIHVFRGLQ